MYYIRLMFEVIYVRRAMILVFALILLLSCPAFASMHVFFMEHAVLISETGELITKPGEYTAIFPISYDEQTGLYSAIRTSGLAALMDENGKLLTGFDYDMLYHNNGYILFNKGDMFGAMDENANIVIPPDYTSLTASGENTFLGLKSDCWDDDPDGLYLITADGAESATGLMTLSTLSVFSEGLMPLLSAQNAKFGYVDHLGQWVIKPQFDFADAFSGGCALASISTGYGVIDMSGNWLVTPKFDYIDFMDNGDILGTRGAELVCVLDADDRAEVFRIEGTGLYAGGYGSVIAVYDETALRVYDTAGNELLEAPPEACVMYGEPKQFILMGETWGEYNTYLYDVTGKQLCGAYQYLLPLTTLNDMSYYTFMEFEAALRDDGQYDWDEHSARYGVIDQNGDVIVEARYENLFMLKDDILLAARDGEVYVITLAGETVFSSANSQ